MAERDVNINFRTKADSSGAKKAEADIKKVTGATKKSAAEAKKAEKENSKLNKSFEGLAKKIPGGEKAAKFFQGITAGAAAATAAVTAGIIALTSYIRLVRGGIGKAAVVEDLEASFSTLLGSTDKAIGRIEDLRQRAAKTPLRLSEYAQASRLLETLTDGALATGDALDEIGDVAAGVNREGESIGQTFQNVALHAGRLFAALQSGNGEIGESINRLQELGVISSQARNRIRELHTEGERGAEAWAVLQNEFSRFAGEMQRKSLTINGRISTLDDAFSQLQATVAAPFVEPFKKSVSGITAVLNDLTGVIAEVNSVFGHLPQVTSNAIGTASKDFEALKDGLDDIEKTAERVADRYSEAFKQVGESHKRLDRDQQLSLQHANELARAQLAAAIAKVQASNLSDEDKANKIAALEASAEVDERGRSITAKRQAASRARRRVGFLQDRRSFEAQRLEKESGEVAAAERAVDAANRFKKVTDEIGNIEKRMREISQEFGGPGLGAAVAAGAGFAGPLGDLGRVISGGISARRQEELRREFEILQARGRGLNIEQRQLTRTLQPLGGQGLAELQRNLNEEQRQKAEAKALITQIDSELVKAKEADRNNSTELKRTLELARVQNETLATSLGNSLSELQASGEGVLDVIFNFERQVKAQNRRIEQLESQSRNNRN